MTQFQRSLRRAMAHSWRLPVVLLIFGVMTIVCLMSPLYETYSRPRYVQWSHLRTYRVPTWTVNGTSPAPRENYQDDLPCEKKFPDCIIVGVMKCGTQALTDFLSVHPDIAIQQDTYAVNFFNNEYDKGEEWYRDQMPCSKPGQVTIEKSPQYFRHPKVPERMAKLSKRPKLLMIIRDPVERGISQLMQMKSSNFVPANATYETEALDADGNIQEENPVIRSSLFSASFKLWLQYFPRESIHIVDGGTFVRNIVEEYRKIEKFLELPRYVSSEAFVFVEEKGFYCLKDGNDVVCMAEGKGRKHPDVDPDVLAKVKEYFRPHNEEFFELIGKRLDWND